MKDKKTEEILEHTFKELDRVIDRQKSQDPPRERNADKKIASRAGKRKPGMKRELQDAIH